MNTERILEVAERLSEQVIAWRRDLHQMPELGVDLPKTSAYVMKQLDEMGVEYESGVGLEHAIVAVIKGKEEGKTVALRADMDALPVKETTGLDFQFAGDRMHAQDTMRIPRSYWVRSKRSKSWKANLKARSNSCSSRPKRFPPGPSPW